MKKLLAGAALAFALSAGGAHAATYLQLVGGCACGLSSYGHVNVTGEGTHTLNFDVELDPGVFFNQAGNSVDTTFSLVGGPAINITSITPTPQFGNTGPQTAGTHTEPSSLGDFMYRLVWNGPPTNNGNLPGGGIQSLMFTVTASTNLFLAPSTVSHGAHAGDPTNFYFSTDISRGPHGPTGQVGGIIATPPGVPEPATWAMMLIGFGGLGALLRRRRAMAVA